MALPDTFFVEQGAAIVWGEAGASGVTATLSLDALPDGEARMGASVDLGAKFARRYAVYLIVETGTAPTAGRTSELYLASSYDNSTWPAGVTGSAGTWPSDSNEDEWSTQLGNPVAVLMATNDGNTVQVQGPTIWEATGRYVAPVVDNNLGQAFRDETTATDNGSRVILIPLIEGIQE
jgi:hypothetical protein